MPPTYALAGAPPCRPAPSPFRNPTTPHPTPPQRLIYLPHNTSRKASKPSQATSETHVAQTNSTKPSTPICAYPPFHPLRFSSSAFLCSNCYFYPQLFQMDVQTLKNMLLLSPSPSPLPCLGDVKTNKQEGTLGKLNEKEKRKTSSKIVVWCVRCPSRTHWQGHRRIAQHRPRKGTQPHHTSHPTTETHIPPPPQQKSKQAKPSHIRNTRSTKQLHKAVDTYPCISTIPPPPILQQCLFVVELLFLPTSLSNGCTDIEKYASTFLSNISFVMPLLCQNQESSG